MVPLKKQDEQANGPAVLEGRGDVELGGRTSPCGQGGGVQDQAEPDGSHNCLQVSKINYEARRIRSESLAAERFHRNKMGEEGDLSAIRLALADG